MKGARDHFPSLSSGPDGPGAVFLDNPGGTQIARESMDSMREYLLHANANHGGWFATSRRSDGIVREAREAMAEFLGAPSAEEIVFGPNMTTLTFSLARALGKTIRPGDGIVVTRLDHDANIAPWLALEEQGAVVRWVDIRPEDCTLDLDTLDRALDEPTTLVAVGLASNAVGTVNDVKEIVRRAHAAGALVFVDAVQYAPHGPIDVVDLRCDFLACSAYKFFGPHVGVLWGRYELLDRLPAYKVRPAGNRPPDKFETGTGNHEGIAGVAGTIRYLETLAPAPVPATRRARLRAAMEAVRRYETSLSLALMEGISRIRGARVWGIADPSRVAHRVPTVSFTMAGRTPHSVAEHLAERAIYVWDGNYYALAVMERLGLEESGGMVRVGAVHYNTIDEIGRLLDAL
jgi:cysteine desulfurase family protein (TIGR01976 family)